MQITKSNNLAQSAQPARSLKSQEIREEFNANWKILEKKYLSGENYEEEAQIFLNGIKDYNFTNVDDWWDKLSFCIGVATTPCASRSDECFKNASALLVRATRTSFFPEIINRVVQYDSNKKGVLGLVRAMEIFNSARHSLELNSAEREIFTLANNGLILSKFDKDIVNSAKENDDSNELDMRSQIY